MVIDSKRQEVSEDAYARHKDIIFFCVRLVSFALLDNYLALSP